MDTKQSEFEETIRENRERLDRREKQITKDIKRTYRDIEQRLVRKIATLRVENEWELFRAEALLRQVRAELARYADDVLRPLLDKAINEGVHASMDEAETLIRLQLDNDLIGTAFNRLPTHAIENLTTATHSGPLADLLDGFGPQTAQGMKDELLRGIALGQNPKDTARNMANLLGVSRERAYTISHTETLRAHREASRRTYQQNSHIVKGYVWRSALDERTCLLCWARHGTFHKADEPIAQHILCRCSMVPVTKTWEELGYTNIPETSYRTPLGTDLFRTLDPDRQRKLLGPTAFEAYQRGDVDIDAFVGTRHHPQWGTTITRKPNYAVLKP